jgi:GNAT superfamily N-acetyltransferase
MNLQVTQLNSLDIAAAQQLVELAGWNQLPDDWLRMIKNQPDGCYKASSNNALLGTVTTISFENMVAWIGMMLVHPDVRRQGIGKRLMHAAIDFLQLEGVTSIGLDATPAGRPLYEQLGFQVSATWQRWKRDETHDSPSISASTLMGVQADQRPCWNICRDLDRIAFGVDRWNWIEQLAPVSFVVATESGYGLLRPGRTAAYLGPVVSRDNHSAEITIRRLLEAAPTACIWDVPPENSSAEALAAKLGFSPIRTLYRMWLGAPGLAGQPSHLFAISDPATG